MLEGDIGGGLVIERKISFLKDNSNIFRIDSSIEPVKLVLVLVDFQGLLASECTRCSHSCTLRNLMSRLPPSMVLIMKFGQNLVRCFLKVTFALMSIKIEIEQLEKYVSPQVQALVQFWKANEIGGRTLLTTRDQPFGLSTTHHLPDGLCSYRLIFKDYEIDVDDDDDGESHYLGRVFRHQKTESTPNVGYYSCKEYSQRDRVVNINNIDGCMAVPVLVLKPSGLCCVGVLEVVTTISEATVLLGDLYGTIQGSFEAVGLRSSKIHDSSYCKHNGDEKVNKARAEIKKVLKRVCTTHKLPLVQTWAPCWVCSQAVTDDGSFNVSCRERLFLQHDASYIIDFDLVSFSSACAVHPLGKGEGVVGRAFSSHNSVFCRDITQFSITKYPLAHFAHEYGPTGCFAICLQSSHTGDDVYVLEFFLPPIKTEGGDPRIIVSLLTTMKQHFQSFTVASGEELGEELLIEVIDFSKDDKLDSFQISQTARSSHRIENGGEMERLDLSDQQLVGVDATDTGNNVDCNIEKNNIVVTSSSLQKCITNSSKRQHRKTGILNSYGDIQQCVGMKLGNAAKNLDVGRSTFKRAPRKRNKNNNSLSNKFVQGAAQEQIRESTQPPISDPLHKHDFATATHTKPQFMAVQDTSTVTIKAKYGDYFIRFQLPVLSGMVEFHQEVAKRLDLNGGTYRVRYQDEDNDWILISCDEDLQYYICNSRSLGSNTVTMSIQPITNCPP